MHENEELRRRNEALYDRAPIAYVTVDPDGVIQEVNRRAELILDAPRERLCGQTIDRCVAQASRAEVRDFIDAVFAAGLGRSGDVVVVRADGAQTDVQMDGVVVHDAGGLPRSMVAIVDVTARRLAEAARRRAHDDVLATVAHDLRGPLHAIVVACDTLAIGLAPDRQRACIAAIERASAWCERLIEDLLSAAKMEHGRLELVVAPCDVHELVREVCDDYAPAAVAAGSTLTASIPEPAQPIVADRDRLHQVLSNLIGNALVHAPGAAIEISVVARGGDLVIAVADDGPGIPPDELGRVFERYRQGARHGRGTGLGLAIVKSLVEAHHGTTAVSSQVGHGTRFEVALPRVSSLATSAR